MVNVVSSAIANTPPPDLLADMLNKRNKVHHFDKETDEDMIPMFAHGVDGRPRSNKHLLPHRNWCAIREYVPGNTPLPTPNDSAYEVCSLGSLAEKGRRPSGLFRRFSRSRRSDAVSDRSRPPISSGLLRTLSRRTGTASADDVGKPGFLTRTMSETSVSGRFGGIFRRRSSTKRRDGSINGAWGPETDEEGRFDERGAAMRGGLGRGEHPPPPPSPLQNQLQQENEFDHGDERYFSVRAGHDDAVMSGGAGSVSGGYQQHQQHQQQPQPPQQQDFVPKPFHRTPTALLSLSGKKRKNVGKGELAAVNLEGALEVTLNAEISPRDPGGSTVPYRLVVPRLWYEYEEEGEAEEEGEGGQMQANQVEEEAGGAAANVGGGPPDGAKKKKPMGIKRLMSLRRDTF